jgi:integrase|nr:MAG TPA: Integrase [Bacteriophage sp.]
MERRKDNKGRVLKEGESQRKDGSYQYRYSDRSGKRHYIYSVDLKDLRSRETSIQKARTLYGDVVNTTITMRDVINRYFEMHKGSLRSDTRINRESTIAKFKDDAFWNRPANSITISDAKLWTKNLSYSGWSYQTINSFLAVIRPAFEAACEDALVMRNPFSFSLSKIMSKTKKVKEALTPQQYKNLIDFVKVDSQYRKQLDIITILYETGMRAGELCGLTLKDVDFENNQIHVTHQLLYNSKEKYHIREPKTTAGIRTIPMSKAARDSFLNVIENRAEPNKVKAIDGYRDFVFVTKNGNPLLSDRIEATLRRIVKSYNEVHDDQLPHITPHTFRHTFCTMLISSGMDIKSVQYLMGHSTIKMTLDVYAHVNPPLAMDSFVKLSEEAV